MATDTPWLLLDVQDHGANTAGIGHPRRDDERRDGQARNEGEARDLRTRLSPLTAGGAAQVSWHAGVVAVPLREDVRVVVFVVTGSLRQGARAPVRWR